MWIKSLGDFTRNVHATCPVMFHGKVFKVRRKSDGHVCVLKQIDVRGLSQKEKALCVNEVQVQLDKMKAETKVMLNQIKQESKVRVQNITADGNLKVTQP